uniref:AP-3 complex subunit delta domain-containing protein n=1 Tax=Micrurus corallinus TaxID=54390 RepID=A0A2D4EN20_MICCO
MHTESDEDIAPAQHVDIITEEMPENALPSDEDDKDPNDPYKALDIDLDKPLTDSEALPVQRHRNADNLKSPQETQAPMVEKKSKKPKKKEKKHKEKEREKEKRKERERKADENDKKAQDVDLWLSDTPPPVAAMEAKQDLPEVSVDLAESEEPKKEEEFQEEDEGKKSKHRKKKHKKEEKSKEKKLPKHRDRGDEPQTDSVQNGTLEEEPLPPMSSYTLLAENPYIKMAFNRQ